VAKPRLYVFAGPNGSGKSTATAGVYKALESLPTHHINADEIAAKHHMTAYDAAVEAERQRREALVRGLSFVVETVKSTESKIDFLREAKLAGYHAHLEYLTTQESGINVARVRVRMLAGGRDVPAGKVAARYHRSMSLLKEAIGIVDTARIYNNSLERPTLIAEKTRDQRITLYPQPPPSAWKEERIRELVG
jgi:predicted ABC-type ATPase